MTHTGYHGQVYETVWSESRYIHTVYADKNTDVSGGRVNSSCATVSKVCFDAEDKLPIWLYLTFNAKKKEKEKGLKLEAVKRGLT